MKANLLLMAALANPTNDDTRCCTDEPKVPSRPPALQRWSSKLRVAVPSSIRVFGDAVRQPVPARVPAGTPCERHPAATSVASARSW